MCINDIVTSELKQRADKKSFRGFFPSRKNKLPSSRRRLGTDSLRPPTNTERGSRYGDAQPWGARESISWLMALLQQSASGAGDLCTIKIQEEKVRSWRSDKTRSMRNNEFYTDSCFILQSSAISIYILISNTDRNNQETYPG